MFCIRFTLFYIKHTHNHVWSILQNGLRLKTLAKMFRKTFTRIAHGLKIENSFLYSAMFSFVRWCKPVSTRFYCIRAPYCWVLLCCVVPKPIDAIEKVQRRFTKRLRGLKTYSYSERLRYLGLRSLELRRLHLDLIFCYKIVFGIVNVSFSSFFKFSTVTSTRGHPVSYTHLPSPRD